MPVAIGVLTPLFANAELHDRGGGFVYDDVLDVTWAKAPGPGYNPRFTRTWYEAVDWADTLALYDTERDTTWDDWRLATTNVDGIGTIPKDCAAVSELECRDNEYGYIYNYYGIRAGENGALGNIPEGDFYWSGDDVFVDAGLEQGWMFNMRYGNVYVNYFDSGRLNRQHATFAVREGDVLPDFDAVITLADPTGLHPHHDGGSDADAGLNDSVEVIVLGASMAAGDPADLDTSQIDASTLRFGPGGRATRTRLNAGLWLRP